MYRCELCGLVSGRRRQMLRHTVLRQRELTAWNPRPGTEVAREVPVCVGCHEHLQTTDLDVVRQALALTKAARLETERLAKASRRQKLKDARKTFGPFRRLRPARTLGQRLAAGGAGQADGVAGRTRGEAKPAKAGKRAKTPAGPVELEVPSATSIFDS